MVPDNLRIQLIPIIVAFVVPFVEMHVRGEFLTIEIARDSNCRR